MKRYLNLLGRLGLAMMIAAIADAIIPEPASITHWVIAFGGVLFSVFGGDLEWFS